MGYTNFNNHLNGFSKITYVTITRDIRIYNAKITPITWSQLILDLSQIKDDMIKDYINYLTHIHGSMNYYDNEILSIPAGITMNAILNSGLYECPTVGKHYANPCKTLYLAFRDKNGRIMTSLYKVKEIIDGIDLIDSQQISVLHNMMGTNNISNRIQSYKQIAKYNIADHTPKMLFVLDLENSITLPNKVRPLVNNSSWSYYS